MFWGIKLLCNRGKLEKISTVEKSQCCSFANKKVKFKIYETVKVNLIWIDLIVVSQPWSKLMWNFMYCIFLSNRQRSIVTVEAHLTKAFSIELQTFLKWLSSMFTKMHLTIAIVLSCYKKCSNFLWYFDGNSPVIICN